MCVLVISSWIDIRAGCLVIKGVSQMIAENTDIWLIYRSCFSVVMYLQSKIDQPCLLMMTRARRLPRNE